MRRFKAACSWPAGRICLKPTLHFLVQGGKILGLFVCDAAEKSRPYLASLAVTEIDLTMACNLSTLRP
jgi:hypothetical protein